MSAKLRVGIAGATGFAGIELVKLVYNHPKLSLAKCFSSSKDKVGKWLSEFYASCPLDCKLDLFEPEKIDGIDVLFLALPHGKSHQFMPALMKKSFKTIDLAADFRLKDQGLFESYYKLEHQSPELFSQVSLGFPELFAEDIKKQKVCANPGCYSTSVILGLYPLAKAGHITDTVVVDAKSGVSGAGGSLNAVSQYVSANEVLSAYSIGAHRHTAEMEEVLSAKVLFTPHLTPMNRGILSSMYIDNPKNITLDAILDLYQAVYKDSPFVSVSAETNRPTTKTVIGTNQCQVTIKLISEYNKIAIFSAIDNLLKGASGQAIQNMNVMFGFEQTDGLLLFPRYT